MTGVSVKRQAKEKTRWLGEAVRHWRTRPIGLFMFWVSLFTAWVSLLTASLLTPGLHALSVAVGVPVVCRRC